MSNNPNIDKLEKIIGVKPGTTDEILKGIKANTALLEACPLPHDFSICLDRRTKKPIADPTRNQRFGAYWRCSKCGGRIGSLEAIYYRRGLADALKTKI